MVRERRRDAAYPEAALAASRATDFERQATGENGADDAPANLRYPAVACSVFSCSAVACSAAAFCRSASYRRLASRARASASLFSRAAFSAMTFASSVCTNETALADVSRPLPVVAVATQRADRSKPKGGPVGRREADDDRRWSPPQLEAGGNGLAEQAFGPESQDPVPNDALSESVKRRRRDPRANFR